MLITTTQLVKILTVMLLLFILSTPSGNVNNVSMDHTKVHKDIKSEETLYRRAGSNDIRPDDYKSNILFI
jgi:hypothetical protein